MALSEFERRHLAEMEAALTASGGRRGLDRGAGALFLLGFRWPGGLLVALSGGCLGILGLSAQLGGLAVFGAALFFGGAIRYVGQWALDSEGL